MATSPESETSFGDQLRRLRIAAGLTQEALAERAGLSLNAISALERGERRNPYPRTVQVLAEGLGLAEAERAALTATITRRRPPAGPRRAGPASLPEPATSLVGRQREIERGAGAIRQGNVRLLTLTGPGGVGKTRLALGIAADLEPAFTDGVAFIPLASVMDAALVVPAIAEALGIQGANEVGSHDVLARHLADRRMLLVLDNFEQVAAAAADLAELMAAAPRVSLLVTSRISLHIDGEHRYPVAPLPVRAPDDASSGTEVAAAPAVQLFVQRARAVRPGFALDPDNGEAVADICARLDGIPLAIELAAAWVRVLSPQAILGNLGNRLAMLTGGGRDRPERLQTMRAAIEWSYDHLPPIERLVFRRLAVCAGGCDLESAAAMVSDAGGTGAAGNDPPGRSHVQAHEGSDLLGSLATLVDHSMVLLGDGPGGETRLGMLETIREFGLERLEEAGEAATVRSAHAHHYLALVSEARMAFEGPNRRTSHGRVRRELDNVRAALTWFHQAGDAEHAQRLASELARFWTNSGFIAEGRAWLDQTLAMTGDSSPQTRFDALYWASILALLRREFAPATARAEAALDLARATDNRLGAGIALVHLGEIVGYADPDRAERLIGEGLLLFERLDVPFRKATAYRQLGELAYRRGDYANAAIWHTTALQTWMALDHPWGVPISLRSLGDAALASSDLISANASYRQSLERWRILGERLHMSDCMSGLAKIALASGEADMAILLLSAQSRLDGEMGYVHSGDPQENLIEQARSVAGAARFDELWQRGQVRSLDAVLDDVMAMPPPS